MLGEQEAAARTLLQGFPRVARFFSSLETALGRAAARLASRLRPEICRRGLGRDRAGVALHEPRRHVSYAIATLISLLKPSKPKHQ